MQTMYDFFYKLKSGDIIDYKKQTLKIQIIGECSRNIFSEEKGIAIRDFTDENNPLLYYASDNDFGSSSCCKIIKQKLSDNAVKNEIYYKKTDDKNNMFIFFQLLKKFFKYEILNIDYQENNVEYKIKNTNNVSGKGRLLYYTLFIRYISDGNYSTKIFYSNTSIEDLLKKVRKFSLEENFSKHNEKKCIILSQNALFELIYIFLFNLYENVIEAGLSYIYKKDFTLKNKVELSKKLSIIINDPEKSILKGNVDFAGFNVKEKYIINNGKIINVIGEGTMIRKSLFSLPIPELLNVYIKNTVDNIFFDEYLNSVIIDSFSGLYETIDLDTLNFSCVINYRENMKIKKSDTVELNVVELLSNIIELDCNYECMGEYGIQVPCAILKDDF